MSGMEHEQLATVTWLPIKITTKEQEENLWEELEKCERRAEDIRRILGILAVEKGLEE